MLKLREPLQLNIGKMSLKSSDGLYERMLANYGQISEQIEPEDLLHVVTRPPEVFFAEGDQNSIFYNEAEIHQRQEHKTQIINNVINRIFLAPEGKLTYQDKVYVTNVLHKLGIKDEQTFLSRLYKSLEENRQLYKSINTLESQTHNLYQKIEESGPEAENVTKTARQESIPVREEILYLHQQVMDRLHTGEIYREIKQYLNSQLKTEQITSRQLKLQDQVRVSNQLYLNDMSKDETSVNLYYHHENSYEEEIAGNQVEEQYLTQNLTSAVLYSLIENIYQTNLEQKQTSGSIWQQNSNSFYGSQENLFQRLQENLYSDARTIFSQELSFNELQENLSSITQQNENYEIAPAMITLLERVSSANVEDEDIFPETRKTEIVTKEGQKINLQQTSELTENHLTENYISQMAEEEKKIPPAIIEILNQTISREETSPEEQRITNADIPSYEETEAPEMINIQTQAEPTLEERVEMVRLENERRVREYNQAIAAQSQKKERKPVLLTPQQIRERTILESRNIFDQPEKVMENIAKDQKAPEQLRTRDEADIAQLLPKQLRQQIEFLHHIETGEALKDGVIQGEEALKELVSKINEVETQSQERSRQIIRQETKIREDMAKSIEEISQKTPDTVREIVNENKEIALVHKVQAHINQEEILEQLEEQKRLIHAQKQATEERRETVVNTINKQETRTIVQEEVHNMDLNRMIQNSVARELEGIEDQIFNSLEYKLEDERKRRGI